MITLFIWTVVAMGGDRHYQAKAYDWRALAQFETMALCEEAVRSMNLQDKHRCLKTRRRDERTN
jgi:hypothetical protein